MSTPTDSPLPDRFDGPLPLRLWLKPVEPLLPILHDTRDKPIGQFTMQELIAWGLALGYLGTTILIADRLLINLLNVAVKGR
jgi:hypothetical protein